MSRENKFIGCLPIVEGTYQIVYGSRSRSRSNCRSGSGSRCRSNCGSRCRSVSRSNCRSCCRVNYDLIEQQVGVDIAVVILGYIVLIDEQLSVVALIVAGELLNIHADCAVTVGNHLVSRVEDDRSVGQIVPVFILCNRIIRLDCIAGNIRRHSVAVDGEHILFILIRIVEQLEHIGTDIERLADIERGNSVAVLDREVGIDAYHVAYLYIAAVAGAVDVDDGHAAAFAVFEFGNRSGHGLDGITVDGLTDILVRRQINQPALDSCSVQYGYLSVLVSVSGRLIDIRDDTCQPALNIVSVEYGDLAVLVSVAEKEYERSRCGSDCRSNCRSLCGLVGSSLSGLVCFFEYEVEHLAAVVLSAVACTGTVIVTAVVPVFLSVAVRTEVDSIETGLIDADIVIHSVGIPTSGITRFGASAL